MNTAAVMRVALALVPRATRQRMAEEWQADLLGCAELGLSTTSVARGALRAAVIARATGTLVALLVTLARLWTLPAGLVLGATCAIFDIPVIVVVALAVTLHGGAAAASCWRTRAPRLDPLSAEPSR